MSEFIGRKAELDDLTSLIARETSDLVVIRGRRRIGKSRLVEEFAKEKYYLSFTGLAPSANISAQAQRDEFGSQLCANFNLPPMTFNDWNDAFRQLSHHIRKIDTDKPIVVLFDEISWMGTMDPAFIPKLKAWWDRVTAVTENHPKIVLILCGSISTWVEENIINSTALFGRISAFINLSDLSLPEAKQFLISRGIKAPTMEILKALSVTGGVPWYLERMDPTITIDDNIKKLCFMANGAFVGEYDRIFHDLFNDKGTAYKKILDRLAKGMCDLSEIRADISFKPGGTLSQYLQHLITAGFVTKHSAWSLKSEKTARRSLYRLSDNYLRFYLKYIEPNLERIRSNNYSELTLSQLPAWSSMIGLQVENLLLNHRAAMIKALGVSQVDIVADNPYVQKLTTKTKGCQIDYLVQTRTKTLYVCEFKFSKRELGNDIIDEMKDKLARFSIPRGFSVVPVLVHSSGVKESVEEAGYFYRIIDIEDFLK